MTQQRLHELQRYLLQPSFKGVMLTREELAFLLVPFTDSTKPDNPSTRLDAALDRARQTVEKLRKARGEEAANLRLRHQRGAVDPLSLVIVLVVAALLAAVIGGEVTRPSVLYTPPTCERNEPCASPHQAPERLMP